MSRGAIATLSTENLLHNLSVIQKAAPQSSVLAMIKANAYGHGLRSVAKRLQRHVDTLGVASIDEALAVRRVGVMTPITLMEGVFEPEELAIAAAEKFHVVFHHESQIQWLENTNLASPLQIWLKMDSGMGRLGFDPKVAKTIYERLSKNPNVMQPMGIMSHLACADNLTHPLNQKQITAFDLFTQGLPGKRSLANSAGILQIPKAHYDVVRPGIALYGISPMSTHSAKDLNLKPVMTLQSKLIAIRSLTQGSSIGYGSQYVCPQDMTLGVVAIGYGDGYPRTAQSGTPVLVNQTRCPIVGRVSMDMTTIDLTHCPGAKVRDTVVLWGEGLPIEEVANHTAHIPYDLATSVQQRVKFFWTPQND